MGPLLTGLLQFWPLQNKHRCQVSITIHENNKWVNSMSPHSWVLSISIYPILTLFSCLSFYETFNCKTDPKEFWESIDTFGFKLTERLCLDDSDTNSRTPHLHTWTLWLCTYKTYLYTYMCLYMCHIHVYRRGILKRKETEYFSAKLFINVVLKELA